jgi:hypothetical protein
MNPQTTRRPIQKISTAVAKCTVEVRLQKLLCDFANIG